LAESSKLESGSSRGSHPSGTFWINVIVNFRVNEARTGEVAMEELRNLLGFVRVVHAGGFSAAAAESGLSAAALSKNVARLEVKLGVRLLARTSRSVQLTQDGELLYERVSRSFSDIQESLDFARSARSAPAGLVRLSTVTAYGRAALLPVLPDFLKRYPAINLQISFHDGGRGLRRQPFDVRITWGEELENDKVAKPLDRVPLMLVASPAYLAGRALPETPHDCEQHDCIGVILPGGGRAQWKLQLRTSGRRGGALHTFVPKGRLVIMDELDVAIDAALAGLGIAAVDSRVVATHLSQGSLVRLLPDYDLLSHSDQLGQIVIQYPQKLYAAPRVRAVVDYLIERLQVPSAGI
jgi:DNA-binding transcriptional LysR family regulator